MIVFNYIQFYNQTHVICNHECFCFAVVSRNDNLKVCGIEGGSNSCYIDASIVALFAFCGNFDISLVSEDFASFGAGSLDEKRLAAKNILKYDIVSMIRKARVVGKDTMTKFRKALAAVTQNNQYCGTFMGKTFKTQVKYDW